VRHPADGDGGGRSVTLLVTPDQAGLLELACASGHPRLVLRNGNDLTSSEVKTITLNDLAGVAGTKNDPYAPQKVVIPPPAPTPVAMAPTTRPAQDEEWTMVVIKGNATENVKLPEQHKDNGASSEIDLNK
jgi:hypothetical protein